MADLIGGRPIVAPYGVLMLAERKDLAGDLATADTYAGVPQMNAAGSLRVTTSGGLPTYFATSGFSSDSTGTDIWYFPGNTSVVSHIQWLAISTVATAAATGRLQVVRRSAANTAGTAVSSSVAQASAVAAAASSAPKHYTAHPTALGASAGVIHTQQIAQQAIGAVAVNLIYLDFRQYNGGQGLRISASATDIIAVNVAAALAASGNIYDITCCWTELPTTA